MKATKYRLACMALEECFGKENADLLFGEGNRDENESGFESDSSSSRGMVRNFLYLHNAFPLEKALAKNLHPHNKVSRSCRR